jgi:pyruvate dehydrogenase E1 component
VSPDVSSTTNLAGWFTKVGVWSPVERRDWFDDDANTIVQWREGPTGQHIELGIAETNLVGLIGELGATWSRWGQPLFPIGVLYDPFVERALEPWSYGIYAGGQSILVGTPSGVSLASEGGAHQSIKTPSIGLEQPGCTSYEPAFAIEVEWTLLDCLSRLGRPDGESSYLRLSTRPVRQELAQVPTDPAARERRRRHVLAGAYTLRGARRRESPRADADWRRGRLRHQSKPTVRSGSGPTGTQRGSVVDPRHSLPAAPRRAHGDRHRRTSAHLVIRILDQPDGL